MFANISPASYNYDETVGTLRYASRAKLIKNAPKINEDPLDAELRKYEAEIKALKEQLANGGGIPLVKKKKKKIKKEKKQVKNNDNNIENEEDEGDDDDDGNDYNDFALVQDDPEKKKLIERLAELEKNLLDSKALEASENNANGDSEELEKKIKEQEEENRKFKEYREQQLKQSEEMEEKLRKLEEDKKKEEENLKNDANKLQNKKYNSQSPKKRKQYRVKKPLKEEKSEEKRRVCCRNIYLNLLKKFDIAIKPCKIYIHSKEKTPKIYYGIQNKKTYNNINEENNIKKEKIINNDIAQKENNIQKTNSKNKFKIKF